MNMMMEILNAHLRGEVNREAIRLRFGGDGETSNSGESQVFRGIGLLPLHGPIFPKANMMTEMSGATSIQEFQRDFRGLMNSEYVSTILLDIDSPGGSADMIPEMAAEIRAARDIKPIIAVANTAMNSAAMYLGAQASKVYATPSGQVGSIGTILVHTDESEKDRMEGVTKTYIHAGDYKAEMAGPLTPDAKSRLQDYVDHHYAMFVNDVAKGRGTTVDDVLSNYGQGSVLTPVQATEAGMIDGIKSFDQVLGRLVESGGDIAAIESSTVPVFAKQGPRALWDSYDADKEHSEPGTGQGGEPVPADTGESDDLAIKGGWRRPSPPIAFEEPETEEFAVNRTWLEAQAGSLNIEFSDETTDEELAESVATRVNEIVVPLNDVAASAASQREMAEQYPEQAAQLAQLLERDRSRSAREFADGYSRFEGSSKGFSPVVREGIAEAHEKIALRTFSQADLKSLLDAVASKEAVVDWSEGGSGRSDSTERATPSSDFVADRKRFAELVKQAQTEDNLSQQAAIAHVSEQNPELAEAYLYGHLKGGN